MECTQRLECTQELYDSRTERICSEQIGFLGICGVKHPVKRGLNKIGRDPQTCSIVINLNSISRQHAVINVLNQSEFMLMDLDSANKTKLMDKTLPAYIPHPLKNGDMVQFGDIFGVFRLLEEDNELPMTQAIDIPETPVNITRHMSKLNKVPITTIPESPDVSDREESFIAPSQPKQEKCFNNSNSQFLKPSAKVISIQPIGTNKIDNVYWSSSKRSVSLNDSSLDESSLSNTTGGKGDDASIYEMETQPPPTDTNDSVDSIYTADTQVSSPVKHTQSTPSKAPPMQSSIHSMNTQLTPSVDDLEAADMPASIHSANTQLPPSTANLEATTMSPLIHNLDTQLPPSMADNENATSTHHLPGVCKIHNQEEMQFDLFTSSKKQNNHEILGAEAPPVVTEKKLETKTMTIGTPTKDKMTANVANNVSAEIILFEDDCQDFVDDFESQPLFPAGILEDKDNNTSSIKLNKEPHIEKNKNVTKDNVIVHSDSSTDCEDVEMLPTQKITEKKTNEEDDLTDCEDLFEDMPENSSKSVEVKQTAKVNFEDMLTQVVENVDNKSTNNVDFEEMLTQVIVPENDKAIPGKPPMQTDLEDLPTQVIVAGDDVIITDKPVTPNDSSFDELPTQVIADESEIKPLTKEVFKNNIAQDLISPFKIPLLSPIKIKRKDIKIVTPVSKPFTNKDSPITIIDDDDNYYAATQDILDDLCTQPDIVPQSDTTRKPKNNVDSENISDDEFLPSSVEEYKLGERFPHLDHLSPKKKQLIANKSSGSSDGNDNVNNFVSNLSSQQVRSIIGVETKVAPLKRVSSDPSASDVELTPKKVRPIKFMDIDLPSSQEIKTSVSMYNKSAVTESSSESEVENDSQECTPILFRKKKKPKVDAKVDLTKLFNADTLPTRVITRVRKPTAKFQNSDEAKKLSNNILKPKFLTEQEDEIDRDIITENISRLKSKGEKSKNKDTSQDNKKPVRIKDETKLDGKENATKSEKETKDKTKINKNSTNKNTSLESTHIDSIESDSKLESKESTTESKTMGSKDTSKDKKTSPKTNTGLKSKPKDNNISEDRGMVKNDVTKVNSKTSSKQEKSKKESKRKSDDKNKAPSKTKSGSSKSVDDEQSTKLATEANAILRSMRSTRNKRKAELTETASIPKEKDNSQNENISIAIVKEDSQNENSVRSSRRQNKKKVQVQVEIDLTEEVVEIRRSSRQKPAKDKKEKPVEKTESDKKPVGRRGRPPKHEQSTVYSLSSESGAESPRSAKRPASIVLDPPSPKRTRSLNSNSNQTSLRATKTHHVLFTAFPCEEVKTKLEKLGAVVVSDVQACTVVLTLQVKRTFKLLCAVGLGKPIVGPNWVQACADTSMIVDPWQYILQDEAAEKRFQFNLERTLSGKRNFLQGFNVSATPKVMPSGPEMKLIVESSGGVWKEEGANWVCVTCSADKALWPAVKRRGATLVSTEFILGGVLRQKAEVLPNKLL